MRTKEPRRLDVSTSRRPLKAGGRGTQSSRPDDVAPQRVASDAGDSNGMDQPSLSGQSPSDWHDVARTVRKTYCQLFLESLSMGLT